MTTNSIQVINIAKEFSRFPGGRYYSDGKYSGQRFREEILVPALQVHEFIKIELDGTLGYGSSFLEESFGGLIRECGFERSELERRLKFESFDDKTYINAISTYLKEAKPKNKK